MYRAWIGFQRWLDPDGIEYAPEGEEPWPLITLASDSKHHGDHVLPWAWTRGEGDLSGILERAYGLWPEDFPEGLLVHALREAGSSDVFMGATPETWSPAGRVDFASLGRWVANARTWLRDSESDPPTETWARFSDFGAHELSSASPCLDVLDEYGIPMSAVAVGNDAILTVVPEGSQVLTVQVDEGEVETEDGAYPDLPPWDEVGEAIDEPEEWEILHWRLYEGENSRVTDGWSTAVDGVHNLVIGGAQKSAALVGRVFRVVARRSEADQSDPLLKIRRKAALRGLPSEAYTFITTETATLREKPQVCGGMVVVVHGTMSHGLNISASLRDLWPDDASPPVPIVRFEHDTWLRLEENATELAGGIAESGASEVLLVAHSRGGLVAVRALQILQGLATIPTTLITLGTPFLGTPVAQTADALWATVHATLGGVRLVGGPAVDATSRVLAWTIKQSPPEGIKLMYPRRGELPLLVHGLPQDAILVGGHTNDDIRDFHGVRAALRDGFAEGVFAGEDNDLVVTTRSALADRAPGLVVCSDHSSYLLSPDVRNVIRAEIEQLPPGELQGRPSLVW